MISLLSSLYIQIASCIVRITDTKLKQSFIGNYSLAFQSFIAKGKVHDRKYIRAAITLVAK